LLQATNTDSDKIGPPFTTDIIQASTRVNYGQNLGIIHGVETMVCMAIEGAMQIEGGNWRIFEGMLNTSKADVHLNTAVEGLSKENGKFTLKVSGSSDAVSSASDQFDTVILAAPLQFTGIKLSDGLVKHVPDNIPYVTLHVTLFATFLKFNESFFNLKPGSIVPNTILTTLSPDENSSNRSNVVGKSGFFSISTLRNTVNPKTHQGEYVYKIFSPTAITSTFLSSLFNTTRKSDLSAWWHQLFTNLLSVPANLSTVATTASDKISWYYPYVWNSYPYEYPRVTFEDIELTRGLYYTSGIESFISTMETSALMGKNVAQLIVDDYFNVMELPADETENLVEGPSWEEL
jgi:prenylcysteine oxidase/farnesylcysteine lyase